MKRKLLSLLLAAFLLFQRSAYADTFIVTSNADSGPGTLREAIAMANGNGTVTTDNIYFNIPDITGTGRTIILNSSLSLSSNIIIDASLQPGIKFGLSDAKIKIKHDGSINFSQGMILQDADQVELYGLYFDDFYHGDPNPGLQIRCAIFIPGLVNNLKIGAPGKGNVFYHNVIAIANRYTSNLNPATDRVSNLEIKSNFFNLNEDGVTVGSQTGMAIMIKSFTNLTIGGTTGAEGNYFAGYTEDLINIFANAASNNGFLKILNNTFGANYAKTIPLKCGMVTIAGVTDSGPPVMSDVIITVSKNMYNNPLITGSNSCHGLFVISNVSGYITITGNTIGNLSVWQACQLSGIAIGNCENGIIGGDNPADQNIIRLSDYGIALNNNRNITIQKNSISCNDKGIYATSTKVNIPIVKVTAENGINIVSGIATPNCKIEVFQTPDCGGCNNGKIYLGETTSDNSGNWSFTGAYTSAITATATTVNGVTGEFASPELVQPTTFQYPICGQNNGSILGAQMISGTKYYWVRNYNGVFDTIYNQLNLTNLGPGLYIFVVEQTAYCTKTFSIYLPDQSPILTEQFASVIQPSCGLANGNILSINATGSYNKVYWLSESRDTVSTSLNLLHVAAGKYKLIVMNTEYGCGDSTEFYRLVNQSGPSLNTANVLVTAATCNNSDGSIANIATNNVTGLPFIQWVDSLNNVVGNTLDLLNQPAGKYKLKFKDQGVCDTIITSFYIIPSTGRIIIDTAGKMITKAGCTVNNGSIRNIHVTGADSYQWQNLTTSTPAGNTIDIYNLPPGNYQLTATNAIGCSAISPVINVPQSVFIPIGVTGSQTRIPSCGQNNGMLRITTFNNDSNLYSFRWIDSTSNQQLATGTALYNIGPGTYLLMATDSNGCDKQITKTTLGAFPKPVFDLSAMLIKNDKCSTGEGSITGIKVTGFPPQLPVTYSWKNAGNNIVGTSADVHNLPAGQYYLTVSDGILCSIQSSLFTISNTNDPGIILQYDNQVIPRNTAATMTIKNFQPGDYFLYSDPAGTQLLQQNTTGNFTTGALNADADYYIKFISGTCVSTIAHVKIGVVDKSFFAIATGFTPNHDGINDRLNLKVIGFIDVEYFKIFNRNGEQVFFTKTINDGWDGKYKGNEQSAGVFVWLAKGKDIHGKSISSKGTFLLIR